MIKDAFLRNKDLTKSRQTFNILPTYILIYKSKQMKLFYDIEHRRFCHLWQRVKF
jgi:hypothetical protein